MKGWLRELAPWAGVAAALVAAMGGGFAVDVRCHPEDRLVPDVVQRAVPRTYDVDEPLPWESE